jgi:DNA/RNA non-specific endonuclease
MIDTLLPQTATVQRKNDIASPRQQNLTTTALKTDFESRSHLANLAKKEQSPYKTHGQELQRMFGNQATQSLFFSQNHPQSIKKSSLGVGNGMKNHYPIAYMQRSIGNQALQKIVRAEMDVHEPLLKPSDNMEHGGPVMRSDNNNAPAPELLQKQNAVAYSIGDKVTIDKSRLRPGIIDKRRSVIQQQITNAEYLKSAGSTNNGQISTAKSKASSRRTLLNANKNLPLIVPSRDDESRSEFGESAAVGLGNEDVLTLVPGSPISQTPKNPKEDLAFQKAASLVHAEAKNQKKHGTVNKKLKDVQKASVLDSGQQIDQSSKERSVEEMQRVENKEKSEREGGERRRTFSAEKFKEELERKIKENQPKTEDDAKALAQKPPLEHFEENFSEKVALEQGNVTGQLEKVVNSRSEGLPPKRPQEIPSPPVHPALTKPIDPKLAIPKPKTDQEISSPFQREGKRIDDAMNEYRLSDDQLAESREPTFVETLKVKKEALEKVVETPNAYRSQESAILDHASGQTDTSLATAMREMLNFSRGIGTSVYGGQKNTESKIKARRRQIKDDIDGFYNSTVTDVNRILKEMTSKVKEDFTNALKNQTDTFNKNVQERISDYYGDWRIDDELFGPDPVVVNPDGTTRPLTKEEVYGLIYRGEKIETINPDVYKIFVEEKNSFLRNMDRELDSIALNVQTGLTDAHNRIQKCADDIANYKSNLKGDELVYATRLEQDIKVKFENLESSIDDAREDLLQTMADQYNENVSQLEKTFKEINDELKKSWLDRAVEFVETVGKTIYQLADLLLSILVRMAHLVWDIIKHPIRFFETLVSGLGQGIANFISNIGTNLQEAFWTWITGATPVQNIHLSSSSGIASLFELVIQVLSLGPADIRAIVERVLGKEFMHMVDKGIALGEKALEPVTILLTKGPGALWEYIQDQVSSIIQSSFDRIRESVFNTFVEKALKWIAGFFIPGGGFVKVVKAIFNAFQFVADNLENIRQFFDSVFDSMESAVQGNTEGVANKIVVGLKKGVVLALDFLAKQLGLDKIIDGVHNIIQSIRRPIVRAIEWVLGKAKPFVTRIMMYRSREKVLVGGGDSVSTTTTPQLEHRARENQIGINVPFNVKGQSHHIWIKVEGASATVMVASNTPVSVSQRLTQWESNLNHLSNDVSPHTNESPRANAQRLIAEARALDSVTDRTAEELVRRYQQQQQQLAAATTSSSGPSQANALTHDENHLAEILRQLFLIFSADYPDRISFYGVTTPLLKGYFVYEPPGRAALYGPIRAYGVLNQGGGHRVRGAQGAVSGPLNALNLGVQFDAAHLIADRFGGVGGQQNLVPTEARQNKSFEGSLEGSFNRAINAGNYVFTRVDVNYTNDPWYEFEQMRDALRNASNEIINQYERALIRLPISVRYRATIIDRSGHQVGSGTDFVIPTRSRPPFTAAQLAKLPLIGALQAENQRRRRQGRAYEIATLY